MNKKGFLFVVTVFLVLTYILLSISVWVKGIEASERAYSEFYKESTVELAIEQITPAKINNVTHVMMRRALFRVNEHSMDHPVVEGPADNENLYIQAAMHDLLINGSAHDDYFAGPGLPAEENSSIGAWVENLNASLLAVGVYVSDFEVSNFNLAQSDIHTVNYSFDVMLKLRDFTNTSSVSRNYSIENELDITGLVDPALVRATNDAGTDPAYRQFFFNEDNYSIHTDIEIREIESGVGGQGWLYGPLVTASGEESFVQEYSGIAPSDRHQYIMAGTFEDIDDLGERTYNQFAGLIITTAPETVDTECGDEEEETFNPVRYDDPEADPPDCDTEPGDPYTGKPFIVAPGFDVNDAPLCPVLDGPGFQRCVLFVNAHLPSEIADDPENKDDEPSAIYSVEEIRDFVMCGYYTYNEDSPSYLQHLLNNSYSRSSEEFGIETFVIGEYANDYDTYDPYSRLDRELFTIDGIKIRGLPGCKDHASCSDEPVTGVFRASTDAIGDYDLDDIDCEEGAGCDE